ncbi:type IV pilus modification protein PilV [Shewanella sp. ULN5]|uniref:type IV pilus modification protein PilV n=1 Tax=Shewanella sp. ULN5 TaxID=2994678 RepID=UPI00273D3451|nr:type IV pilus modification protein PilV [Shewanella sp. ULN5]MDP5145135.1 type IV pilus modification protein PilV [Shewanella sp. ULN5]
MQAKVKGFSLIEVMVSLLILVIGLIGIFNLHIVAKRGSFESFQQTQASYYANDIINRMKLNRSRLAQYDDNSPYVDMPSTAPKSCNGAALCSADELMAWDLYEWRASFSGASEKIGEKNVGGLDTPTACIEVNANTVTVVLAWRGIRKTTIDANLPSCGIGKLNRRIFSIQTVII